jgi:hypothetical protein
MHESMYYNRVGWQGSHSGRFTSGKQPPVLFHKGGTQRRSGGGETKKKKLRGLSLRANNTDRATAASRRS